MKEYFQKVIYKNTLQSKTKSDNINVIKNKRYENLLLGFRNFTTLQTIHN